MENLFGLLPARQERFRREEISSGVNFYSSHKGASNLIVGFAGSLGRLNMAAFQFLEELDDSRHDLLLLSDLKKLHFDSGIEGYARSLPELTDKVRALSRHRGHRTIITYGTSMGGLPALRGGDLLGADRAISVGGRFIWHPSRIRKQKLSVNAFDTFCHCRGPLRTRAYLLYAQGKQLDVQHAAMATAIMPECRVIALPGDDHNFPFQIRAKGNLGRYFSEIFSLDREPDDARLIAMLT